LKLASKKYYKLSVYIFGYTASFSIIIAFFFLGMFVPTDIEVMYGNYNNTIVNLIFYVWMLYYACAMWLQIMYIIYYKTDFFPHLYVDNVIKSLENLDKSVENRENRYKPLTLVK
ncbi:MAG: hypothetical protein U9N32_06085, partial [Spirochaetota bacterium]|nr:hypothetical protein [Spirochaetota bacterium]